jgi:hypothetical protein
MYVCMYVCMNLLCVCACEYTRIHICGLTSAREINCAKLKTCVRSFCVCLHAFVCLYVRIHVYMHCMCVCIYIYIYMYVYIYIHIYIHTYRKKGKEIKFHQNCENANRDNAGWKVSLGAGSYPRFNGNTCDDDAGLCSIANCRFNSNQLRYVLLVCVYICVYVYVCRCVCIYMCVCVYICVCICM